MNKSTALQKVKLWLDIKSDDTSYDAQFGLFFDQANAQLLLYINNGTTYYQSIPTGLDYIIPELIIGYFNRNGDEGKSISKDGDFQTTWVTDMLANYKSVLQPYRDTAIRKQGSTNQGFYFI